MPPAPVPFPDHDEGAPGPSHLGTGENASLGSQQVGLLPEAGIKFGEWLRLLIMQRPLQ